MEIEARHCSLEERTIVATAESRLPIVRLTKRLNERYTMDVERGGINSDALGLLCDAVEERALNVLLGFGRELHPVLHHGTA